MTMDTVGISSKEQEGIFRVIAAIHHLGNIEFAKGKEIDSSMPKDEKSWFHLKTAAEMLMCDAKALEDSLCRRVIVTRDETITKELDPESATSSRDVLAKIVYSRLFDWLVDKINSSIGQDPNSKCLIGVLDIYRFESFKTTRCLTGLVDCLCILLDLPQSFVYNHHWNKKSDIVDASGISQPCEVVSTADGNTIVNNTLGRPVPTRPWEQQTYGSTYGDANPTREPKRSFRVLEAPNVLTVVLKDFSQVNIGS